MAAEQGEIAELEEGIATLAKQVEEFSKEKEVIKDERDTGLDDLHNVEAAMLDLVRKKDRITGVLEVMQQEELDLKDIFIGVAEGLAEETKKTEVLAEKSLREIEELYDSKEHAVKTLEDEIARYKAQLRLVEIRREMKERDIQTIGEQHKMLCSLFDSMAKINSR